MTDNTDCHDNDSNEYPGQTWYKDADGDDYGDGSSQIACTRPANHFTAAELTATSGDCNDGDANFNPGISEVCDGLDNNCNSQVDEGVQSTFYLDADSDGYGDAVNSTQACSAPAGYVSNNTDCNDADSDEYPGQTWYKDADGDGYGDGSTQTACARPADHFLAGELTATSSDCNDSDAGINPAASEACGDGIDNNCDTQIDEGCCAKPDAICQNFTAVLDNSGNASISVANVDGGSTADCGLQSLGIDLNNFDCSDIGTPQNVTLTITDINSDSDQCTAIVTVSDTKKPSISCPGDFTQNVDAGICSTTVSIPTATASDNCGTPTLDMRWRPVDPLTNANQGPWSGWTTNTNHNFDKGKYKFQWRATDGSGNNKKCTRYVEVQDNEDPDAICQDLNVALDPNTNQALITPQDVDNGSSDNCAITNMFLDQNSFDCLNVGTTTVTLTIEDESGNSDQCTADISIDGANISIDDVSKNEGNGSGFTFYFFKIERSGVDCATNVDYTTNDGTATLADNDYVSGSGTAYFPPVGSNIRYVICRAKKDNTYESNEMFYVDLTNASNGAQLIDNQGEAEVMNDDIAPILGNPNENNNGLNDFETSSLADSKIALFPNPAVDVLNISLEASFETSDNMVVELYDVLERKLGSFKISEASFTLDISSLQAGNYFLMLKSGEESSLQRFVKVD